MSDPTISVLMPCYNAERWLDESITSILSQTFSDFEFIIVNDGSRDKTLQKIEQYAASDDRIKVVDKANNTGLTDALNIGIRVACGEWIARIDADDVCEQQRLERQLAYVNEEPDMLLLGSGCSEIDSEGKLIKTHRYPRDHASLVDRLERSQGFFPHSSAFYRRDVVQHLGGYRKQFEVAQDCDLWLRLCVLGRIGCVPEPLVRIRKHDRQISHYKYNSRQLVLGCAARTSHFIRRHGLPDPVDAKEEATLRHFFSWVEQCMHEADIFSAYHAWREARAKYFSHPSRLLGTVIFAADLLRSRHAVPLIVRKLFGLKLPQQLAEKWIKQSMTQ